MQTAKSSFFSIWRVTLARWRSGTFSARFEKKMWAQGQHSLPELTCSSLDDNGRWQSDWIRRVGKGRSACVDQRRGLGSVWRTKLCAGEERSNYFYIDIAWRITPPNTLSMFSLSYSFNKIYHSDKIHSQSRKVNLFTLELLLSRVLYQNHLKRVLFSNFVLAGYSQKCILSLLRKP